MAPAKSAVASNQSKISLFFTRPNHIPKNRGPNPDTPREEPPSTSSQSNSLRRPSVSAALAEPENAPNTHVSREKCRYRTSYASSEPQSSQSRSSSSKSNSKRARARKSESQQLRDDQLLESDASPPSRQTPRQSPLRSDIDLLDGAADFTPTHDLPYRSASNTPSERQVVAGADFSPSPKTRSPEPTGYMSAHPVPVPASIPQPQFSAPVPASSSVSRLTSLPNSQASTLPVSSSSNAKRVGKDGRQCVPPSDSDDSSDELEDIPRLGANKRRKLSSESEIKVASSTYAIPDKRQKPLTAWSPSPPPKKKVKHSLASLVAQHERDELESATIASLESAADKAKLREQQAAAAQDADFDASAIIDAAGSDSDARQRMQLSMSRTEALKHDEVSYRFFLDGKPLWSTEPFPIDRLPDEPWATLYKDETSRKHACISGFAAELAAIYRLPLAVTTWMSKELLHESDNTLCEAYIEVLRASSHYEDAIWNTAASLNSMYMTRSLFENIYKKAVPKANLPSGVKHIVRVAAFLAPAWDSFRPGYAPSMTCAAFLDLALMNVDDQVKENAGLSLLILDSIEDLLQALSDDAFQRLIPEVVATFYEPSDVSLEVRCQSIIALPASTPRAYRLRRLLASECFATANDRKSTGRRNWAKIIVRALRDKPELQVNESTDFGLLMALVTVLDIAVSGGWTPYRDIIPGPPTGPWNKPAEPSLQEQQHNSDIDAICKGLRNINNHIKTAGTTHMKRVQAKTAIENAINRLENSVRARPKPKKGIFSAFGGGISDIKQATFERGTFSKTEDKSVLPITPTTESKSSVTHAANQDANVAAGVNKQSAQTDEGVHIPSSPPDRLMVNKDDDGDISMADIRDSSHDTIYYDAHSQIQGGEDDSSAHNDTICR